MNNKPDVPEIKSAMKESYVAFLDVLGFRAAVARSDFDAFLRNYKAALDKTLEGTIEYVVFSDSIVLRTQADGPEDLRRIVIACSQLMYRLLVLKPWPIAVRGAISKGYSYLELTGNVGSIVAGPAIVDAYDFERRQDWVGVMIAPRVRRDFSAVDEELLFEDVVNDRVMIHRLEKHLPGIPAARMFNVPLHKGEVLEGIAVIPTCKGDMLDTWSKTHDELQRSLTQLRLEASEPDAQQKYRRTSTFLSESQGFFSSLRSKLGPSGKTLLEQWKIGRGIEREGAK